MKLTRIWRCAWGSFSVFSTHNQWCRTERAVQSCYTSFVTFWAVNISNERPGEIHLYFNSLLDERKQIRNKQARPPVLLISPQAEVKQVTYICTQNSYHFGLCKHYFFTNIGQIRLSCRRKIRFFLLAYVGNCFKRMICIPDRVGSNLSWQWLYWFFRSISHHLQVNAETMPHIKYLPHNTVPVHFEIPSTDTREYCELTESLVN